MVELRAIEREDLPQMLTWRNNPKNRRFFREYRPLNMKHQTAWLESLADDRNTQMFAITESGELVGACGLTSIDWLARSAEVSLYIGDCYLDEDMAPQALKCLEKYAQSVVGLRRLWAEVWAFDVRKRALFTGYTLEATKRQAHWANGWHDVLIYGRLF